MTHPLLTRQLARLGLDESQAPTGVAEWRSLLNVISRTYHHGDQDRERLERAQEVSTREAQEHTREIKRLALLDRLTGLPNRALFLDRASMALAKAKRTQQGTAALFVDLDNFKLINDCLGHDAGDQVLRIVAERLKACVRPGDTVARLGGDEFTVLLENLCSQDEAEAIAQRILESLWAPLSFARSETLVASSIGLAYTQGATIDSTTLIKNADTAMYHAKTRGKSCFVVFDAAMDEFALDRLELETCLRQALQMGELAVQFQPLVSLSSGIVVGAEALARWNHPARGWVPPSRFIPIAEEIGVIVPIGYWVMEQACRRAAEWRKRFALEDFSISVNLSGKQLLRRDVVERVGEIVAQTGIDPHCLKLEITESALMEDQEAIVARMRGLKALGVKLAIDDFGTGYSSLAALGSYPIDTLKIDRNFVSRLEREPQSRAIIEAIVGLARSMNMDVTGEGIETENQRNFIFDLGCDLGQGYYFAHPLNASELEEILRQDYESIAA